jgi:hypothetical protein
MKLTQLNEEAKFTVSKDGLIVYLDPQEKVLKILKDGKTDQLISRGLMHTIRTKEDYKKLAAMYKIDISFEEWVEVSNEAKKQNKDSSFRTALAAMQMDILDKSED